ncbi:hypothetical protein C5167_020114 [Papaver somniferum]|uniref:TFIIS central domain-containing protein n=1 Tax=Papaver somniferum TaxID=3469 RepID=A0A4Y7IVB1_PAPSO|nr:uncharacterized protein LOC113349440 [Papaver somniferum]RZC51691.1 hypothetical protein C5167_020114 [Papaver somniferum]
MEGGDEKKRRIGPEIKRNIRDIQHERVKRRRTSSSILQEDLDHQEMGPHTILQMDNQEGDGILFTKRKRTDASDSARRLHQEPKLALKVDNDANAKLAKSLTTEVRNKWLGMLFKDITAAGGDFSSQLTSVLIDLEKSCAVTHGHSLRKYQIKLRQLRFNLARNEALVKQLLNGDLKASTVVEMSPEELKTRSLTAEDGKLSKEPMEMECRLTLIDADCQACNGRRVWMKNHILNPGSEIIGKHLECLDCGKGWFSPSE